MVFVVLLSNDLQITSRADCNLLLTLNGVKSEKYVT